MRRALVRVRLGPAGRCRGRARGSHARGANVMVTNQTCQCRPAAGGDVGRGLRRAWLLPRARRWRGVDAWSRSVQPPKGKPGAPRFWWQVKVKNIIFVLKGLGFGGGARGRRLFGNNVVCRTHTFNFIYTCILHFKASSSLLNYIYIYIYILLYTYGPSCVIDARSSRNLNGTTSIGF